MTLGTDYIMTTHGNETQRTQQSASAASAAPANGIATAIGSLPHRDAAAAARFALSSTDLPALPTLPRRSPAEGLVGQAIGGLAGVSVGQYGSISVDPAELDPCAPVVTDLQADAFGGFRAFLTHAAAVDHRGPVKWQFIGPVTFGLALMRAGIEAPLAFDVAANAVRSHLVHLERAIRLALPHSHQVVFIDEPAFEHLLDVDFPLAPDTAIDHASMAMSALEPLATVGVHCCLPADSGALMATGPQVLAVPARGPIHQHAGSLNRFLAAGGVVAWGAVPTEGPITSSAERPWTNLSELWCTLVQHGVDPAVLRRQSMVTPECGLGSHTPAVAERVHRVTREISRRVGDQARATMFSLGA